MESPGEGARLELMFREDEKVENRFREVIEENLKGKEIYITRENKGVLLREQKFKKGKSLNKRFEIVFQVRLSTLENIFIN
jgi:hypothetical protein